MKNEWFPTQVFPSSRFHPVSTNVEFKANGAYSKFYIDNKVHGGLTKRLKQCFYPDYKYSHPVPSFPEEKEKKKEKNRKWGSKDPQQAGMRRGTALDRMLTKMLEFLKEYDLPHKVYNFRPVNVSKQTKAQILDQYKKWLVTCNAKIVHVQGAATKLKSILNSKNKHIFLLWKKWDEVGYQLVATQLSVGALNVCATNIDCVLRNVYNQHIIVEIKTGYQHNWNIPSSNKMKHPFEDMNDCPANQALLQAAFGQLLYHHTFPTLKERLTPSPIVYRVTPEQGVSTHYLPDLIQERMPIALQALIHSGTRGGGGGRKG